LLQEKKQWILLKQLKWKWKSNVKTVQGGTLTAWMMVKIYTLQDESGGKAKVTITGVNQSNG
jgi:uncharacterized surface protein with fasciclin (FAS1) repeats